MTRTSAVPSCNCSSTSVSSSCSSRRLFLPILDPLCQCSGKLEVPAEGFVDIPSFKSFLRAQKFPMICVWSFFVLYTVFYIGYFYGIMVYGIYPCATALLSAVLFLLLVRYWAQRATLLVTPQPAQDEEAPAAADSPAAKQPMADLWETLRKSPDSNEEKRRPDPENREKRKQLKKKVGLCSIMLAMFQMKSTAFPLEERTIFPVDKKRRRFFFLIFLALAVGFTPSVQKQITGVQLYNG